MTTTANVSRANDVSSSKNDDTRKSVSYHLSKHLSLNSLFLQSLGDDDRQCSISLVSNTLILLSLLSFF